MNTNEAKSRGRIAFLKFKALHPERIKEWSARNHRNRLYKYNYGISADRFDAMIAEQNNMCPIGNHVFGPLGRRGDSPCLDHCHKTDKVRMVLCKNHNSALGLFNDSIEDLQAAVEYLIKFTDTILKS